jgi:hypothetical protein
MTNSLWCCFAIESDSCQAEKDLVIETIAARITIGKCPDSVVYSTPISNRREFAQDWHSEVHWLRDGQVNEGSDFRSQIPA